MKSDLADFLASQTDSRNLGEGSKWSYHIAISKFGPAPFELWLDHIGVYESLRSTGVFTEVLAFLETHPQVRQICVGNLHNRRFREFFIRRGYTPEGEKHVWLHPR